MQRGNKNYKNQLRFTKVIVKNKMPRFLWFTVYILYTKATVRACLSLVSFLVLHYVIVTKQKGMK